MKACAILSALFCALSPLCAAGQNYTSRYYEGGPDTLAYSLFLPRAYTQNPDSLLPLITYLHGAGSQSDIHAPIQRDAQQWAWDSIQNMHACFVLSPWCPVNKLWADWTLQCDELAIPEHYTSPLESVIYLIKLLITHYPIDSTRLYLQGYSMGGSGSWKAAYENPGMFAAVMTENTPRCCPEFIPRIKSTAFFIISGQTDGAREIAESTYVKMQAAQMDVRYEVIVGGHVINDARIYSIEGIYNWFFERAIDPNASVRLPQGSISGSYGWRKPRFYLERNISVRKTGALRLFDLRGRPIIDRKNAANKKFAPSIVIFY